jgi:hypothetical protein
VGLLVCSLSQMNSITPMHRWLGRWPFERWCLCFARGRGVMGVMDILLHIAFYRRGKRGVSQREDEIDEV